MAAIGIWLRLRMRFPRCELNVFFKPAGNRLLLLVRRRRSPHE